MLFLNVYFKFLEASLQYHSLAKGMLELSQFSFKTFPSLNAMWYPGWYPGTEKGY